MASSNAERASSEHNTSALEPPAKQAKTLHDANSNTQRSSGRRQNGDYTVAWVCALPIEMAAAHAMLDEIHENLPATANDTNAYILGNIGQHNIAVACLPMHQYGTINAAVVASNLVRSFPSIRVTLMVGIGGGAPRNTDIDLRLGDVVVGCRVMPYELGKVTPGGQMERTGTPKIPPIELSTSVSKLRAIHELNQTKVPSILRDMLEAHPRMTTYAYPHSLQDRLFLAASSHTGPGSNCDGCDKSTLVERPFRTDRDPKIHYGGVASGNGVMRDGITRDRMAQELDVICFEMEAAGLVDHVPCLVVRGICDYADTHKSKEWQKYAAATAAAYAKELLLIAIPVVAVETTATLETASVADLNALQQHRKGLLNSLRFKQTHSRQSSIKAAHARTCKWLLEHPTFMKWRQSEAPSLYSGFLWISGKPGAGKSTIMKSAYARVRKECACTAAVAAFFFHARGEYLEKSTTGMHRSLLLQLLESFPDLQWVFDDVDATPPSQVDTLNFNILRELFRKAILDLGDRSFMCFIDALDECDEQQVLDMVEYFEDLGHIAAVHGIRLRICFSSRHYPYIYIRGGLRLTLEDQQGHRNDLEKYVRSCLRADSGPLVDKIRDQILQKAAGVFMWVVLVVDILNKEFQRGRLPAVQSRLEELPDQLSELFRDILRRDNDNMEDLLLCIQWILYANRPLKREEFYFGVWSGLSIERLAKCQANDITEDTMDRFITSSSKGLAELTKFRHPVVQFIHESVRDFLIKDNGLLDLWPEFAEDFAGQSHKKLKQCCHEYIMLHTSSCIPGHTPIPPRKLYANELEQKVSARYPFLEYATTHVLHHANAAAGSISQDDFLAKFGIRKWIEVNNIFTDFQACRYTTQASLLYILADQGLSNLVEMYLRRNPRIDIQGERNGYPLFAAVMNEHTKVVRALVEQGEYSRRSPAHIDTKDPKGRTPLLLAIEKRHTVIVRIIVEHGADLTMTDPHGQGPLLLAVKMELEGIVRILLEKGADTEMRDRGGRTPLSRATESIYPGSAKLLLEKGANVEARDADDRTPLSWAAQGGSNDVIQSLIRAGADKESMDSSGRTPLSWATTWGIISNVRLLVKSGANIESADLNGRTPLSWAAQRKFFDKAQFLVQNGSDINSTDTDGRTPLLWAAATGSGANVRFLLATGADITSTDGKGRTALSLAAEMGHVEATELLIQNKANVGAIDLTARTPLSWTAGNGHEFVAQLLVEAGSDIVSEDMNGRTPLSWAIDNGHHALAEYLRMHLDTS